jgi:25S rRNA (uracil2634-N3)-methyltransferase
MLHPYGEIHVSHKTGHPYDNWNLECLAAEVSLAMFEKSCFQKEDYPGYNNKRGSGPKCDETFPLGSCCTLKFRIGDLKKHKKRNQNRVGPVSLIGGHNSRAENFANNIRPFHLPPLVQPWPWPHFTPVQITC